MIGSSSVRIHQHGANAQKRKSAEPLTDVRAAAKPLMRRWLKSCRAICSPARRTWPTRHITPTQLVTLSSNANLDNIPAKVNRKQTFSFSRSVYHLERFFNRTKQMHGLAARYDIHADNYMAAIKLAATRIRIALANKSMA
jgi:transposase